MSSDIIVQTYSKDAEQDLHDALQELSAAGLSFAVKIHQPGPQAALEWLVPTALMLWVGDKYCGAFLEEAGKDHYQALKRFIAKLFDKTLGKDATVRRTIRTFSGIAKPDVAFSGNLSIGYQAADGWTVKLLFPLDVTSAQCELACQRFAELIFSYVTEPATSPLAFEAARALREKAVGLPVSLQTPALWKTLRLLIFWNSHEECFYTPDPIASGIQRKLVARRLGAEGQ